MSPALTHLALHVRDLDASVAFYREFCALEVVHERQTSHGRVVWLAPVRTPGAIVFVLLEGGSVRPQEAHDYSHLGFALGSSDEVDALAARAEASGCLAWSPRREAYPVGYYCGVRDPDGRVVEFSHGQPLGRDDI